MVCFGRRGLEIRVLGVDGGFGNCLTAGVCKFVEGLEVVVELRCWTMFDELCSIREVVELVV